MATIDELGARAAARVRGQVRPFVSLDVPTLPQPRSPRRWAVLAAGALAAASLVGVIVVQSTDHERTPPPSGTTDIGVTTTASGTGIDVVGNGLVFHLPAVFRYSTEGFASTGEGYGNFYSTAPMPHGPCTDGCGIGNLAPTMPNTVVIGIGSFELPVDPNDHANTTIAGLDAHFLAGAGCGGELISVRFGQGTFGTTIVRACLSGPDLAAGERLVREILATATRTGDEEVTTPSTIAAANPDLDASLDPSAAIEAPAPRLLRTFGIGNGPGELGNKDEQFPTSPVLIDSNHLLIDDPANGRTIAVERGRGESIVSPVRMTTTIAPPTDGTTLPHAEMFGTDLRILWNRRHVRWRVPASVGVTADGLALPDGSFVITPANDLGREDVVRLFPDGSSTWWRLPKLVLGSSNGITIDDEGIHVLTYDGKKFRLLEWPLPPHS